MTTKFGILSEDMQWDPTTKPSYIRLLLTDGEDNPSPVEAVVRREKRKKPHQKKQGSKKGRNEERREEASL
jgi:hypothetical protein